MANKRGNGEGSVFYSEQKKRWLAQFNYGRKPDGSLNRKTVYGKTRVEAYNKMAKALEEIRENTFVEKSNATLIEMVRAYYKELYESNSVKLATHTRHIYVERIIENFNCANTPIQEITRTQLNNELNKLTNYSQSVISKTYQALASGYNYAVLNHILYSSPFTIKNCIIKPISKVQKRRVDALDETERKLLIHQLDITNDDYRDQILICMYTGMRVGEVLALTKDDIDLTNNVIHVNRTLTRGKDDKYIVGDTTKTYAGVREVPILAVLKPILRQYMFRPGYLFIRKNGEFITPPMINNHFKKVCKDAGIKPDKYVFTRSAKNGVRTVRSNTSRVNTHMLRHTFATMCIEAGMQPVVLQKMLGHRSIKTTLDVYTSVFDKYRDKELNKLDNLINQTMMA